MLQAAHDHLLGLSCGDAVGLFYEGANPKATKLLLKAGIDYWVIPRVGLGSDDSDHALLNYLSYQNANGAEDKFQSIQANFLRLWILALPIGIGLTTLKACGLLLLGISSKKTGIRSGGNGPLMRSGVLGLLVSGDMKLLKKFCALSTRSTHLGEEVETSAFIIAIANRWAVTKNDLEKSPDLLDYIESQLRSLNLKVPTWMGKLRELSTKPYRPADFFSAIGCKTVTGYSEHTAPAVFYCIEKSDGKFLNMLENVIRLGGDVDTVGAVAGGLFVSIYGIGSIPDGLRSRLRDPVTCFKPEVISSKPLIAQMARFYLLILAKNLVLMIPILVSAFKTVFLNIVLVSTKSLFGMKGK